MGVKPPLTHTAITMPTPQDVGALGDFLSEVYAIVSFVISAKSIETLDIRLTGHVPDTLLNCLEQCRQTLARSFSGLTLTWGPEIGRHEMLAGIKNVIGLVTTGEVTPEKVTEDLLNQAVSVPKIDLLLIVDPTHERMPATRQVWARWHGPHVWGAAYAEFFFTTHFTADAFFSAVETYYGRDRRQGGLSK